MQTNEEINSHCICSIFVITGKGTYPVPSGRYPIKCSHSNRCIVTRYYSDEFIFKKIGINIDTNDCTIFEVMHVDRQILDIDSEHDQNNLLEEGLFVINELSAWYKAQHPDSGIISRRIARPDIRLHAVGQDDKLLYFYKFPGIGSAQGIPAGRVIPDTVCYENSPYNKPISNITRSMITAVELLNGGFYKESFVSLFALVDHLVQEVTKAGLKRKGLKKKDINDLMRAIEKDNRLHHYLCNLIPLCGWNSMEDKNNIPYNNLIIQNRKRNEIMHENETLFRDEAIKGFEIMNDVIEWLAGNPFEYVIEYQRLPIEDMLYRKIIYQQNI